MDSPSTDEMDSTTPDERASLIGNCPLCSSWTRYDSRTDPAVCATDDTPLDLRTIQSQRTWTESKAKAKRGRINVRAKRVAS